MKEFYIEEFESGDLPTQYEICISIPNNGIPHDCRFEHVAMCAEKKYATQIVTCLNNKEPQKIPIESELITIKEGLHCATTYLAEDREKIRLAWRALQRIYEIYVYKD